jgi:hypothetical protein
MNERTLLTTSTFTKVGANMLYVMMRDKFKCQMVDKPTFNDSIGLWEVSYYDPKVGVVT